VSLLPLQLLSIAFLFIIVVSEYSSLLGQRWLCGFSCAGIQQFMHKACMESMAMKNWSCSVAKAICTVPSCKTDVTISASLVSLLFSLFLHRKDSFVETMTLTVCWCLNVWGDYFWKNLISKFF